MRSGTLRLAIVVVALSAATHAATAQGTGAIRGRVADDAGHPLAASISATRVGTGLASSASANATGAFFLDHLAAGVYEVTAQRIGYRRTIVTGVVVRAGEIAHVDVSLTPFAAKLAPVVVQASTITIKAGDAQFESRVGETELARLPIGYDLDRALALTPGGRPGGLWGGASVQANSYQIDGVAVNDPGVGGRLIEPNVDWIDEVAVRGLGAPAEYGNFQGGLVDMITKSGGNTRRGFLRANAESGVLNEPGFTGTELVPELSNRRAVEAEARGPVVRDRLFYYGSAQVIGSTWRAVDHLSADQRFSSVHEQRREDKALGKLTWTPHSGDLVNLSLGWIGSRVSHYGLTGRETADATSAYSAPVLFSNLSWERPLGSAGSVEIRGGVVRARERVQPRRGLDVPGISTFQLASARDYQNAPFYEERRPSSNDVSAIWRATASRFGFDHRVASGVELSAGRYSQRRIRTGGMTWRPRYGASVAATFDAAVPQTWPEHVPTSWGGEVHLDTDVRNLAEFVQDEMTIGRLTLSPGLRVGQFGGRIASASGEKLRVVDAAGVDPRLGVVLDLSAQAPGRANAQPTFVLKLHAGRYHQNLFGQMFDRAAGSSAYSDQELWEYEGPLPDSPTRTFTRRERDSLAALGLFTLLEHTGLSEVGAVHDLREPYVDQLVAGVQKLAFERHLRLEALYVHRVNRDQIALEDRNLAFNWTAFHDVRAWPNGVLNGAGVPITDQHGRELVLPVVYVPNDAIIATLREHARWCRIDCVLAQTFEVPGFVDADTARLTWKPDYALTNVAGARRRFDQLQVNADATFARWTAGASLAWSNLEGNLASVTGYDEATIYGRDDVVGRGPGPFVRPNELLNAFGKLGGYSKLDVKLRATAELPWRSRAGVFVHASTGDRIAPEIELTPVVFSYTADSAALPAGLFTGMAGTRIFTAPRGSYEYPPQITVDLHLDRGFGPGGRWQVALDAFNVMNNRAVTARNLSLNAQADPDQPLAYAAPLGRLDPRQLRLGAELSF